MLSKITRLSYRIFKNQTWPVGLQPFLKYNVIYGWNGCGKTTLSGLFRKLEKREALSAEDGSFEVEIGGTIISASDFSTNKALPPLKVFNRDFVEASVFTGTSALAPIYYFGEDTVEKQKQIEVLRTEHIQAAAENLQLKERSNLTTMAVEQFCSAQGKIIKNLLSSSPANTYNNYDKARFKTSCARLAKLDHSSLRLSEPDRESAKKKKEIQKQDILTALSINLPDFSALRNRASTLSATTVVSRVINNLANDPIVASWVQTGLPLHKGERQTLACRFCNQSLPPDRLENLEAHFNQAYQKFLDDITKTVTDCVVATVELQTKKPPIKEKFYPHLRACHAQHTAILEKFRIASVNYLNSLVQILEAKRKKPFEVLDFAASFDAPVPDSATAAIAINGLNDLVSEHNETTENLVSEIDTARQSLEDDSVAEALAAHLENQRVAKSDADTYSASNIRLEGIARRIRALEIEISDSIKPADELTKELANYLGQTELKFEQKELGYVVMRNGEEARHLSEGEKTAVAFLYFLKSLHDRSFRDANGIVVIDDPISSLDANALFCAFGYMRGKTKHAAQLFVLTHNFTFFRQVKNWFQHLNKFKRDANKMAAFYMLRTSMGANGRTSQLQALDPLLLNYESEYHYLFYRITAEASRNPPALLEEFYAIPNIARRFLEAFLAFRFPNEDGLHKQLERATNIDEAKRSRIIRFLHTHSHDGKITEPEHDLSILSETPQILKDVIEVIQTLDQPHFIEMQAVLASALDDRN